MMVDFPFVIATCGTLAFHSFIGMMIVTLIVLIIMIAGALACGIEKFNSRDSLGSLWQPFIERNRFGWAFAIMPFAYIGRYFSYIFRVSFCVWFALSFLL